MKGSKREKGRDRIVGWVSGRGEGRGEGGGGHIATRTAERAVARGESFTPLSRVVGGPAPVLENDGPADTLGVDRRGRGRRKVDARWEGMFTRDFNVVYDVSGVKEGAPMASSVGC